MTNCIVTHHQWRDLKAWQECGLPLSTPSNEAAKMFDAFVTQLVGWYQDKTLGGTNGTIKCIREADPDYVLGPLLESTLKFSSHRPETFPQLGTSLSEMEDLLQKGTLNKWEMKQVEAVRYYVEGYPFKSVDVWEEMVMVNPLDVFSLRMAYLTALKWGHRPWTKSLLERVVPFWKPDMALYGYIQGMYGYALYENNCHKEAEKYALKALEINPCDCWSTHAKVHIMEDTNRAEEGIVFMEKTEQDWTTGTLLLQHNYWHLALFYLDKGDFESALGVVDDHILPQCTSESIGPLNDGASLLYRFQLEGIPTGRRFHDLNSYWYPSEHVMVFQDVHRMMSHLGAKDYESVNSLLESSNEFLRQGKGTNWEVTKEVGMSLCEAMVAFDKEQYDDVVELMLPVRDDIIKIGGSGPQRDVFNLLLIHAAIRSTKQKHRQLATQLIKERKEILGDTGVTNRLEEQLLKPRKKS